MGNFIEEWIVRIERWTRGDKPAGYFLVTYEKVSERVLSNEERDRPRWRFTFREPIFHEAESCAGRVPVASKDGKAVDFRPARIDHFQRTKMAGTASIPALENLPCLIANEPPKKAGCRYDTQCVQFHAFSGLDFSL